MTKFVGTLNIPSLASAPAAAIEGDLYYNTSTDKVNFYNGSTWSAINQASGAMNYAQTQATKQSTISENGVTIVSASIATNGYPVQVVVTGDAENSALGGWIKLQLFRDSTAIGKQIHVESSAVSENIPYALTVIDTPAAGTYTYALKTASAAAAGTFNFGETDGPVLTAIELSGATTAGVTTLTGTANQITASASTGAVTLSLPQSIATTSSPTFTQVTTTAAIRTATAGADEAIYVGDDAIIADVDTADTLGIYGQQAATNGGIVFGSGKDTNLYRSAANTLKTDDNLIVAGDITGDGVTTNLVHGITLQRTTTLTVNTSTDASATAITWSSAVKNTTLYAYWSSGSTITIPLTGWYSITCHLASGGGLGTGFAFRLYVLVNGTVVAKNETQAQANTNNDTPAISTIQYLTAADALIFRASASASSKTIGGSRISGCSVVYMGNMSA